MDLDSRIREKNAGLWDEMLPNNISYKDHVTTEDIRKKIQATIGEYGELLTLVSNAGSMVYSRYFCQCPDMLIRFGCDLRFGWPSFHSTFDRLENERGTNSGQKLEGRLL